MTRNPILPKKPELKVLERAMKKNTTLGEILLWQRIRLRKLGVQFHRRVPVQEYIVDFFCNELKLAIDVQGNTLMNPNQEEREKTWDIELQKLGITLIRIKDEEVKENIDSLVNIIQQKVDELRSSS